MLELNNYFIKEIKNLKDLITVVFVIIDDAYEEITPTHIKKRRNYNKATLSDSEIITISIVGELITIDSESAWLTFVKKNYSDLFPDMCDRSRFNRTRRNLHAIIGEIRKYIVDSLGYNSESLRIIDSMPIPVCKFGRAYFNKNFKVEAEYGYCASKKETFYGFKLHALTTANGFITDFVLSPANIDDREAIWELAESYSSIDIIGDKGYIAKNISSDLKSEKEIQLIFMKRNNSKKPYSKSFRQLIFKVRRRIETTFSQLTEQLNTNKVLAKSMWGFVTRVRTKILAHNLCYFMNLILGKTINLGRIKSLVFG